MEIILQNKEKEHNFDCVVQYGKGIKAGEIACGFSGLGEKAIFVGTADLGDETYEDGLLCGVRTAMSLSAETGYQHIAIDIDSFAPDPSVAPYIVNALLDCLLECHSSLSGSKLTIYLIHAAHRLEETLLQGVEDAIFAPVKVNENQSFGDYGDPLKKEFQEFLKELPAQKPFREHLLDLIAKKDFRKYSDAYRKCGVSKSTFSKITNFSVKDHKPPKKEYKPSKGTVAAFAIGLELDLAEAQKLFHAAGYHLDRNEKMDRVVRFFIEKQIYDIHEVNYCLAYFDIPLLGEHCRDDNVHLG